jgi:Protein of unknown function (DUF2783)
MPLNTEPNFSEPGVHHRWAYTPGDAFYDALIAAHHGLSDAQSELLNARLVLLLANHVGDLSLLREAIALARAGVGQTTGASGPVPGSSP